ncbi:unknown [Clostridium sp. CAG:571]|nr:unknown [Clostridium sp. CAG:571]
MKKSFKITTSIIMVIVLLINVINSYAVTDEKSKKSFFEIQKSEVTKKETIQMNLNLEEITYIKFTFKLESNANIKNVKFDEKLENDSKEVNIEKSNNEIIIEINKENTNLDVITLNYNLPEDLEVNDTISFKASIINNENSSNEEGKEEKQEIEKKVKIIEDEKNDSMKNDEKDKEDNKNESEENNEKSDEILEKDNKNISNNDFNEINKKIEDQNTVKENSVKNVQNSNINTNTKNISTNQSEEETSIYNGSNNNYLSNIIVNDYSLNKEFTKDNSTYFVTVGNDVNSLNITTEKEEVSSTVSIYGNENLSVGKNKILICVTAENGNVRIYRIYVTKNAE